MTPGRLAWNAVFWGGAAAMVAGVFAALVGISTAVVLRWRPGAGA